jgi:hypothetical protein
MVPARRRRPACTSQTSTMVASFAAFFTASHPAFAPALVSYASPLATVSPLPAFSRNLNLPACPRRPRTSQPSRVPLEYCPLRGRYHRGTCVLSALKPRCREPPPSSVLLSRATSARGAGRGSTEDEPVLLFARVCKRADRVLIGPSILRRSLVWVRPWIRP